MNSSSRKLTSNEQDSHTGFRVRHIGRVDYQTCLQAMKDFTENRNETTPDEFWIVEHAPVYTVGLNIRKQHYPDTSTVNEIPVIESDRGGDITYHGPGQVVIYLLLDIRRQDLGIRKLVNHMEQAVIDTLEHYKISATRKEDAPGVYVNGKKISALGLRIRKGCCYHGLSFNVDMDTGPFTRIPPCGYQNLEVTQLSELTGDSDQKTVITHLLNNLQLQLGYNHVLPETVV